MTDNIRVCDTSDPGGPIVATDDVNGVHYPLYKLAGADGALVAVDEYSGAVNTIEQEHAKIHAGAGFNITGPLAIANIGGVAEMLAITPAFSYPHFRRFRIALDAGPLVIEMYEGTTYSDIGTPMPIANKNRNSPNLPKLAVYEAPTVTDDGERFDYVYVPASKKESALGSQGLDEWILKPETVYLMRITNNTTGAGTSLGSVDLFWYE
jgi:hypothetical protein